MWSYHDSEYFGAAHGACAILQVLITVKGYYQQLREKDQLKIKGIYHG